MNYAGADGTATSSGKQADYLGTGGQFSFAPGETTHLITPVYVVADSRKEADETFFVNILSVTNASILDGQGVGTILNDD